MARVFFPAIIEGGSEPGFSVFFPDLGMHSAGDTVQQAALNAEEGLRSHVALMAEEGLDIPRASELDAVKVDPDVDVVARILVGVDLPTTKVLRLNVTLPEDLVRRIDAETENRSGFLAKAAELALKRHGVKLRFKTRTTGKVGVKHRKAAKPRKSA
jgi:predicted RNase H-like HicB family nuclease